MPPIQTETFIRSGTTAEWADADASDGAAAPVLGQGELGIDTTTNELKVGDGTTAFANLPGFKDAKTGRATLVAGTVVVANTGITAASNIFLTHQTLAGQATQPTVGVSARSNGVSFTILSSVNTDTSVIAYMIVD